MASVSRLGDTVFSATGSGYKCRAPLTISIATASSRVFSDGLQVARGNVDKVDSHPKAGCGSDGDLTIIASSRVFAEGNSVARIGDSANSDNTITAGSSRVFCG